MEGTVAMAGVKSFTELYIWQRSRQWSKTIFQATTRRPFSSDERLVVQINDSSESVMSNIAEGFGRGTQAEFVVFLGYAIGSLDETRSHLCAAYDRGYLDKDAFVRLFEEGTTARKIVVAFIGSMVKHGSGVRNLRKIKSWTDEGWEIYERVTGNKRPAIFVTKRDDANGETGSRHAPRDEQAQRENGFLDTEPGTEQ
jgi:four helix bundle protein